MDDKFLYELYMGGKDKTGDISKTLSPNFHNCPDFIPVCAVKSHVSDSIRTANIDCDLVQFWGCRDIQGKYNLGFDVCLTCTKVYLHKWDNKDPEYKDGFAFQRMFTCVRAFLSHDAHYPAKRNFYPDVEDLELSSMTLYKSPTDALRHLMFAMRGTTYHDIRWYGDDLLGYYRTKEQYIVERDKYQRDIEQIEQSNFDFNNKSEKRSCV